MSPTKAPQGPPTQPDSKYSAQDLPHGSDHHGPAGPWQKPVQRGWSGGRIAALVVGCVLALVSVGLLAGGGLATWAHNTQRDAGGYLTTETHLFSTRSYALTSGTIDLGTSSDAFTPAAVLGTVRLRVTPIVPQSQTFVGVGPTPAVNSYLSGVSREDVTNWPQGDTSFRAGSGATPNAAPTSLRIWSAQSSGTGTQTLTWNPRSGSWTVVVMNTNANPGLSVRADIGATVPDLGWIAVGLIAGGALILLAASALIIIPIIRASR